MTSTAEAAQCQADEVERREPAANGVESENLLEEPAPSQSISPATQGEDQPEQNKQGVEYVEGSVSGHVDAPELADPKRPVQSDATNASALEETSAALPSSALTTEITDHQAADNVPSGTNSVPEDQVSGKERENVVLGANSLASEEEEDEDDEGDDEDDDDEESDYSSSDDADEPEQKRKYTAEFLMQFKNVSSSTNSHSNAQNIHSHTHTRTHTHTHTHSLSLSLFLSFFSFS